MSILLDDESTAHWIVTTVLGFWRVPDAEHIAADIISALHEEEFL